MPASFLSKLNECPSWTRLLRAPTWLTRLKGPLPLTYGVRPFGSVRIDDMTPEELWSSDVELVKMPQSGTSVYSNGTAMSDGQ